MSMKLIDKWFKFPIRMFDDAAVRQASSLEDATGEVQEVEYVIGWQRVPYSMIHEILWKDSYTRSIPLEDVKIQGCDLTLVELPNGEVCVCDMSRKVFEEHFNDYLERMEKYFDEEEKKVTKTSVDEK